jgi:hypothetical protein
MTAFIVMAALGFVATLIACGERPSDSTSSRDPIVDMRVAHRGAANHR